ncbi:hypothetical protein OXT66_01680 [Lentilactobacillus senioris]|uniref:hypothetical protein n=1 Tax=Lentilactobacillus senioris TaxID=931534 RepID=UPI00227E6BC0|nr:hypothetical protein [Lentilactobacillus senioris]MCY9806255.1 hypothetical protein [Lentilactobacillus senioris]
MKLKSILLTTVALGSFGMLANHATNVKASVVYESGYIKESNKTVYVTTKKSLKTNLYRNINGKKVRYVIPKGTNLVGSSEADKQSDGKFTTTFNAGFYNYNYAFKSSFVNWKNISLSSQFAFKSSDFKVVKNPSSVLGTSWERGTDFKFKNGSHQMFSITQDHYIQFYSTSNVKKAGITSNFITSGLDKLKPTTSRKITSIKTSGKNVTYLYYTKPITGLTEYKVRPGLYRLKVNTQDIKRFDKTVGENDYTAIWQRAFVGGKAYNNVLEIEYGD